MLQDKKQVIHQGSISGLGYNYVCYGNTTLIHTDGDIPAIWDDEIEIFVKLGQIHRLNNPAIIYKELKAYCSEGKLHRDGLQPAFSDKDLDAYYTNGELYSYKLKPKSSIVISDRLSDNDKLLLINTIIVKDKLDGLLFVDRLHKPDEIKPATAK